MHLSQSGFIKLPVVLAAVFGLGLGASMYLNWFQHQQSAQEAKLLNGTIVDLRYQVAQDKLTMGSPSPSPSASPSDSASPEPSPSPVPSSTPAVAGASTVAHTLIKACNVHPSASTRGAVVPFTMFASTAFAPVSVPVTFNGSPVGGYQNITVNGKKGFVELKCVE